MAVGDGVGGTSLHAVSAKNASRVVDVIDLSIPFTSRNTLRIGIFGCFNVYAIGGTRSSAQKTSYAFLEAVFVALQYVNSPIARLDARRDVGKALSGRLAKHGAQGDAETLVQGEKCFADFSNDGWHQSPL